MIVRVQVLLILLSNRPGSQLRLEQLRLFFVLVSADPQIFDFYVEVGFELLSLLLVDDLDFVLLPFEFEPVLFFGD